jgi:hypothetical protein
MLESILAQRLSLERQLAEIALTKSVDSVASAPAHPSSSYHAAAAAAHHNLQHLPMRASADAAVLPRSRGQQLQLQQPQYSSAGQEQGGAGDAPGSASAPPGPLSDDLYGSQDFAPLSLDSQHSHGHGYSFGYGGNLTQAQLPLPLRVADNKENEASGGHSSSSNNNNSNVAASGRRSISDIMSPKQQQQKEKEKEKEKEADRDRDRSLRATNLRESVQLASAAQGLPSPTKAVAGTSSTSSADAASKPERTAAAATDGSGGLLYSTGDVGRILQQYSFRYNSWVDMRVDLYDAESGQHLLTGMRDGKSQLQDLRKKPVRLL